VGQGSFDVWILGAVLDNHRSHPAKDKRNSEIKTSA
jgi:hypothetical protein